VTSDKKWRELYEDANGNVFDSKDTLYQYGFHSSAIADTVFVEKDALTEAQAKIEELVEALREAIGYVETSIPEPSHFGSCTPETFCDMTCSEIFHTSNLIYKIKNILSKHHGERQVGDE